MIKVSIVEDIEAIRSTIKENIDVAGDLICLSTYSRAESALVGMILKQPDVVIMDIGLEGEMNGIECMVKFKQRYPKVKFLMFTVFENDDKVFEALKSGADGYILKRENPDDILKYIREVNDGGAPMSRIIAKKVLDSFKIKHSPKKHFEALTPRQEEILNLLADGYSNRVIGQKLNLTEGTIKQHCHKIYIKLQVNNKVQAINKYLSK